MPRPVSYEEAAALIPGYMRPGLMTNLAGPRALCREELFIEERENGLFILRRREGWWYLTFLMTAGPVPEFPGRVVTELVSGPRGESGADGIFRDAGFCRILSRVRLVCAARGGAGVPGVTTAGPEDLDGVWELLRSCFDPLTGCLPGRGELLDDLSAGRVLTVRRGKTIAAALRFYAAGRRAEIRQLAVGSAYRGQGLAGALTDTFLARASAVRCTVWTGSGNGPALAVYKRRGFCEDGYTSVIMMKG